MDFQTFARELVALIPTLRRHLSHGWWRYLDQWHRDDILHDAILWALIHWNQFDPQRGTLSAWLKHAILRRVATNHARGCARDRVRIPSAEPLREGAAGQREAAPHMAADIENAFAGLPADERAVALAVYLDAESVQDAAAQLAIPKRTAERRLSRARERLQRALRHYLADFGDVHEV